MSKLTISAAIVSFSSAFDNILNFFKTKFKKKMILGNRASPSLTGTAATKFFVIFVIIGIIAMGIIIFQAYKAIQEIEALTAEETTAT